MATVKMTPSEFEAKRADIQSALTERLHKELKDCAWEAEPASDLWDLPTVDSKTVCKLSPVVLEKTGQKLDPKWVRKGGYENVDEAISDLMAHIAEHCVAAASAAVVAA
jgi:hypothetical protein